MEMVRGDVSAFDSHIARVNPEDAKGLGLPTAEGATQAQLTPQPAKSGPGAGELAGKMAGAGSTPPKPTLRDFLQQSHARELARRNDPTARAEVLKGDASAFVGASRVSGEDAKEGLPLAEGDWFSKAATLSRQARLAGRNA